MNNKNVNSINELETSIQSEGLNESGGDDTLQYSNNKLPNSILHRIFSQLSYEDRIRVERVCHFWNTIAISHHLWCDLESLSAKIQRTRCHDDKKILNKHLKATSAVAKRVGTYLRELCIYDFAGCDFMEFYRELAPYVPNIEHLHVTTGIPIKNANKFDFKCVAENTPNLKSLSIISHYDPVKAVSFNAVMENCNQLEALHVPIYELNGPVTKLPATLKFLLISHFSGWHDGSKTEKLMNIVQNCTNIHGIVIEHPRFKPHHFEQICALKNLKLVHTKHHGVQESKLLITGMLGCDAGFILKNLQSFAVDIINEEILNILARSCPQLKNLSFRQFEGDLDQLSVLSRLHNLKQFVYHRRCSNEQNQDAAADLRTWQNVLAKIAENRTIEHIFTPVCGTAQFIVNSIIRPCPSLRAFCYHYHPDVVEAEKLGNLIQAMAENEAKVTGGKVQRHWPLDVFLNMDGQREHFERSMNARQFSAGLFESMQFTTKGSLPDSPYIRWHYRIDELQPFEIAMLRKACSPWINTVPDFLLDYCFHTFTGCSIRPTLQIGKEEHYWN